MARLTVQEFNSLTTEANKQFRESKSILRSGQCYFNVLQDLRPDLAKQIRGNAQLDPFYYDDNTDAFIDWLCQGEEQ